MKFKSEKELSDILSLYREEALAEDFEDSMDWLRMICESAEEGAEILSAIEAGCLIPAYFEDNLPQVFLYPIPILKNGCEKTALSLIADFCRVRELREVISGVPADRLSAVLDGVLHAKLDSQDGESYTVAVETECMLAGAYPELMYDDIYLSEPTVNFKEEYKRIILDGHINKFTGYDIRRENPEIDAEFFVTEARAEFDNGTSLTLFATLLGDNGENVFIGEGVLYRFDGRGGAELSVRLLPEWCGKGYGKKLVLALLELGRQMTLRRIYAIVRRENLIPAKMFSSLMEKSYENEWETAFFKEL